MGFFICYNIYYLLVVIMSLRVRKLANSVTQAVNENIVATIRVSTGYIIDAAGKQVPQYQEQERTIQVQSAESEMLEHFGFANQQGTFVTAYADGIIPSIQRYLGTGNAMVVMKPYGENTATEWQVMRVVESYNDWVKVLLWNTGT